MDKKKTGGGNKEVIFVLETWDTQVSREVWLMESDIVHESSPHPWGRVGCKRKNATKILQTDLRFVFWWAVQIGTTISSVYKNERWTQELEGVDTRLKVSEVGRLEAGIVDSK